MTCADYLSDNYMARGLSDTQKAVLDYLATQLDHDPVWLKEREAGWASINEAPPPLWAFTKGASGQRDIHRHLLEATGKDIADGNLSRLCSSLVRRGLVRSFGRGRIQLSQYADAAPLQGAPKLPG